MNARRKAINLTVVGITILLAIAVFPYTFASGAVPDAYGMKACGGTTTKCSVSLTLANTNDLIYTTCGNAASSNPFTAATDDKGHSLIVRQSLKVATARFIEVWYEVWNGSGTITLSCNYAGSSGVTIEALAVSGVDTTNLFDGNPRTNTCTSCNSVSISTSSTVSSGMVVTFAITNGGSNGAWTVSGGQGGYRQLSAMTSSSPRMNDGSEAFSTALSSVVYTSKYNVGTGPMGIILDVVRGQTATSTSSLPQNPFNAGSNINYAMTNNGQRIQNLTVTMLLNSQINGVSSNGGNWSLQINAYAPAPYKSALMQWVVHYNVCGPPYCNPAIPQMYLGADYWDVQNAHISTNYIASNPYTLYIPSSDLIAGTQIQMQVITNATGSVNLVTLSVTRYDGVSLGSTYLSFANQASNLKSPFVAFEVDLVGHGNWGRATFSSLNATLTYQTSTPLTWTSVRTWNLPYVESHAYTQETANDLYGVPIQETMTRISQTVARN